MSRSLWCLVWDTLRPVYVVVAGTCAFSMDWTASVFPGNPESTFNSGLTVGSVVCGFLVSAQAIVLAANSETKKRMEQMGAMVEVMDNFRVASYVSMGFVLASWVGIFGLAHPVFRGAWMALALGMLYSFHRITWVMYHLVKK